MTANEITEQDSTQEREIRSDTFYSFYVACVSDSTLVFCKVVFTNTIANDGHNHHFLYNREMVTLLVL